jgi:hypothetical protein
MHAEIGAFRKILTQQSVGILIGTTLPWAVRIAEIDGPVRNPVWRVGCS